jgi:uncharacterized membrane protein YgcG
MDRVSRRLVAIITAAALITATGCGGATWPGRAVGVSSVAFTQHALDVARIDILPLDLRVWAEPGFAGDLGEIHDAAAGMLMAVALDTLAKRNYNTGAIIDGNGLYPGGTALSPEDLQATMAALSRYGAAAARSPGQLPVPYLPARLGAASGAEATLYIGGWAYVTPPRESTGEQVAKAILIGLAVVAIIGILVALTERHGGGHHASSHGGGVSHGGVSHGGGGVSHGGFHHGFRPAAGRLDAFGRTGVDITLTAPDWGDDAALPHDGGDPQLYLEMTLVDNRTGLALWHAHQTFPAQLTSGEDVARAMRTLLALLPAYAPPIAQP